MSRQARSAVAVLLLGAAATLGGGSARAAAPAGEPSVPAAATVASDVAELPARTAYRLDPSIGAALAAWRRTPAGALQFRAVASGSTPSVGTKRMWPALDQVKGTIYTKEYTLRGVGRNIEVWVASGSGPDGIVGTDFPPGDCRKAIPGSTTVADDEITALMNEYDNNMLPKESKAFSAAPPRAGTGRSKNSVVKDLDFSGDGDKTVTLVDNVRDPNFYDFPKNQTYVAGFFSSQFNDLTDRNVMTIDAYDWKHRTGVSPNDEQAPDICRSRPARPRLYEGIFAHEYQHLLQHYIDPKEVNWVNEGLSDYAISLTGYGSTTHTVFERKFEAHLICYNGFGSVQTKYNPNPQACGGPQNSLTLWGDEGEGAEILADYGEAWSFMLYLHDHFGPQILEFLHRDDAHQGVAGVQAALDKYGNGASFSEVLHDFQLSTLLDRLLEHGTVTGVAKEKVTSASLNASINLLNPAAFALPGVAPNGADYVPLRTNGIGFLRGDQLTAMSFVGARTLPAVPLRWTVVPRTPLLPPVALPAVPNLPPTNPIVVPDPGPLPTDHPALFSGDAADTDASALVEVTVPTDSPKLTYTSSYNMENGFDWGYTIVSTDGGRTFQTLANQNTRSTTTPAPAGEALTGSSPIATQQSFDLSPYAGRKVILGFRYLSDPALNAGGWYIYDVRLGNTLISDGTSTTPFRSMSEINPVAVKSWTVALVGLDEVHHRALVQRTDGAFEFRRSAADLKAFAGYPVVVAVISFDDPEERVLTSAPYSLAMNEVVQQGGR